MSIDVIGQKDGFLIRLAKAEDAAGYFEQNFCPLDQEVVRLTGCKEEFTKDIKIKETTVDIKTPGIYKVIYEVKDSKGKTTNKESVK